MKIDSVLSSSQSFVRKFVLILLASWLFFSVTLVAEAATLSLSPSTGVYQSNGTFSVAVLVNSQGQAINAAEGTLRFNPNELSVVSVNRSGSIFNLWVTEPNFNNTAGTINFSGGLPSGYTGSRGSVMNITFRAKGAGTARVSFVDGAVLANDGRGTNVLTTMNGGSYTLQAATTAPVPEVIEYVAPANTPGAPSITSNTHPSDGWSKNTTAELSWTLPSGVTAVRTLLNDNPTSVPTRVYEDPIRSITLEDLPQGESWFHLQFQNENGWGRVTHYRLAVDSSAPSRVSITQPENNDFTNPIQTLAIEVTDEGSGVAKLLVKVNDSEPYEVAVTNATSTLTLEALPPGYQTVIIEAFDQAGNSFIGTYSFTILAFDKPVFTEYPTTLNEGVIPVIRGLTRPNAQVVVSLGRVGNATVAYEVTSDEMGVFTFIPEGSLTTGVYELSAVATDQFGAMSDQSEVIRIAVQQPGYIQIGSFLISFLSVIIPLIALIIILIIGTIYLLQYLRRYRGSVRVESTEALLILRREFTELQKTLRAHESNLLTSRKTQKLTKAESDMIEGIDVALQQSQRRVEKEIIDVQNLTKNAP